MGSGTAPQTCCGGGTPNPCGCPASGCSAPLPAPWADGDVGSPGAAGSASYSGGTFQIASAGADIYGTSDAFHFVYQNVSGDAEIVARVSSLTNTSQWAKAGVMARQSLDASSSFAYSALWPASGAFLEWRASSGTAADNGAVASLSPPYWVKLVRTGNEFSGFASPDGANWSPLGTMSVPMSDPIYIGLAVTSHADPTIATAAFDGVTVSAAVGGCVPAKSCPAPNNCGTIADGCGGTISCGSCASPQTCGGGGTPNVCGGGASSWGGWMTGYWYPNGWTQPASEIPWGKYTHLIHKQISFSGDGSLDLANSTFYRGAPTGFNYPELVAAGHSAGKKVLWGSGYDCSGIINRAMSPGTIATTVSNIVGFTVSNGYDGIEIDWECNVDVAQYIDLVRRLRAAMPNKVIVLALGENEQATVAAATADVIDQANLMCYDEGAGSGDLWYNAAIYGNTPVAFENSCDLALGRVTGQVVNWTGSYTSPGVPISKIGAGAPFYGYRYFGCTHLHDTACVSQTNANAFPYSALVTDPQRWQPQYQFYDTTYKSDYLSIPSMNEFDAFSGPRYMADFAAWGKSKGVAGFMTFSVEDEYLAGQSGDARYPLTTALYDAVTR
jgi:hypothetical protein